MGASGIIQAADHADLRLTSHITQIGIFRIDVAPASGETVILFGKGNLDTTDKPPFYVGYHNIAGTLSLVAGFVETGTDEIRSATVAYTLRVGVWYSIARTYNATTRQQRLYIAERWNDRNLDGAVAFTQIDNSTLAGAAAPHAGTAAVTICSSRNASASEVALYDAVIVLGAQLQSRIEGTEGGLVACWPLDDGRDCERDLDGNAAAWDIAGGGHNATLTENAEWTDDPHDLLYQTGLFPYAVVAHTSATRLPWCQIEADAASEGYPETTLRDALQAAEWQGGTTVLYRLGCPFPVGALLFIGDHLATTTILVDLYETDPTGAADASFYLRPHSKRIIHLLERPHEVGYIRLTFNGATTVGVFQAFATWEPSSDCATRPAVTLRDPSVTVELLDTTQIHREREVSQDTSLAFRDLVEGEALELMRILRMVGGGQPVLVIEDPGRNLYRRSTYGYLPQLPEMKLTDDGSGSSYSVGPIVVREDRP